MEVINGAGEERIYQLLVTLLGSKTAILRYTTPHVCTNDIKRRLYEITKIPPVRQRLVTGTQQLEDDSVVSCSGGELRFPTVWLTLRLRGGKGGFGSLLRGAATKAGQKKTSNFDACRDMSGRRLRHVNAEKRLEEWKAEEEERRLEKNAEEFLKKMAKKGKKGAGDGEAEKYVAKYRQESERCVSEVLDSVRDAVNGKRKGGSAVKASESKKLKIWMGKRKLGESDSDIDDTDDEEENEKSIVLHNGNNSDSSKEAERSSGSVTGGKQVGGSSGGGSCESGSEEEKEIAMQGRLESDELSAEDSPPKEQNHVAGPVTQDEKIVPSLTLSSMELEPDEKMDYNDPVIGNVDEAVGQSPKASCSGCGEGVESTSIVPEVSPSLESNKEVREETAASTNVTETDKPLNFDEYNSAAEMEALGMERLKSELQARGLKCGGTLQERAARLFLLKSTPVEKLPKKLLAKK
ncbi:uncharacterized protein LOC107423674 [Ziziphus jujuba]|uniref:Uncharacterized protein LOC107423674 n=1 Tax=Ziziphus jujuba TaxID=326968 RepID=A0A6P4ARH1_ZIZJJ|nr:uncharacterized protein LOC107423674 [Ziziphus jujuba]